MRFLAVDDEIPELKLLKRILENARPGVEIYTFHKPSEAYRCAKEIDFDVAFLDIEMGGMDGLELGRKLKGINPNINLIFVTGYLEYAPQAFKLHASGYLPKPVTKEKVELELSDLRRPMPYKRKETLLTVKCFGNFAVFHNGIPVKFKRAKAQELFAYLVDREGSPVTNGDICGILWEDLADEKKKNELHVVISTMKATLEEVGAGDVYVHTRNQYAIKPELLDCDLYALKDDPAAIRAFNGDYMEQYPWAEVRKAQLLKNL